MPLGVTSATEQFGPSELLAMGDYPGRMDHNAVNSPESQLVGGPLQENKDKAAKASDKDNPPAA